MLGDLWALDSASHAWAELDAEGKAPHVRCSQAVAAGGSDIFMAGRLVLQVGFPPGL